MIRLAAGLLLLALAGLSPARAQLACPFPFSAAGPCTPITASASGSTGAISATFPAVPGRTAYICGLHFNGTNATAANPATAVTVTGTITGSISFGFPTLAAGAAIPNTPPIDEQFAPCIAAGALNTAIVINGPALGAGATLTTITAWGYYL